MEEEKDVFQENEKPEDEPKPEVKPQVKAKPKVKRRRKAPVQKAPAVPSVKLSVTKVDSSDNDALKQEIAELKEKKLLIAERATLEQDLVEQQEASDKLTGTIKKKGFRFTKKDFDYLSQFDATGEKLSGGSKNFYQCTLTDDCPRDRLIVAGQTFTKEVFKRRDGICPQCSKGESKKPFTRKRLEKIPIQAGDFLAVCPVCRTKLKYDSQDYRELPTDQNYTISGDTIFCIAALSHTKTLNTPEFDTETQEEIGQRVFPYIDFIHCSLVKVSENAKIAKTKEVDLRRIWEHYDKTAIKDESNNVLSEGEKRVFFKKEQEIVTTPEEQDIFATIEDE